MAYAAHGLPDKHAHSHAAAMEYLGTLGLATTTASAAGLSVCTSIDGVAIKANLTADQAQAGYSTRAPRWGIPGDTVYVHRAGDMIPEITGAMLDARPAEPFTPPTQCPRCGGDIDRTNERWRCSSGRACGAKATLPYFTSRDAMDIEGLGDKTLDVPTLATMDRLGTVSATNLVNSIAAAKARPLSRVLTGLGIRMTGRTLSRITRHFGTMEAILAATHEQWEQVDGIGSERAAVIIVETRGSRAADRQTRRTRCQHG